MVGCWAAPTPDQSPAPLYGAPAPRDCPLQRVEAATGYGCEESQECETVYEEKCETEYEQECETTYSDKVSEKIMALIYFSNKMEIFPARLSSILT